MLVVGLMQAREPSDNVGALVDKRPRLVYFTPTVVGTSHPRVLVDVIKIVSTVKDRHHQRIVPDTRRPDFCA